MSETETDSDEIDRECLAKLELEVASIEMAINDYKKRYEMESKREIDEGSLDESTSVMIIQEIIDEECDPYMKGLLEYQRRLFNSVSSDEIADDLTLSSDSDNE